MHLVWRSKDAKSESSMEQKLRRAIEMMDIFDTVEAS